MVSILVMRLSEEAVIKGAVLDMEYSQRNILYQTERNEFSFTTSRMQSLTICGLA